MPELSKAEAADELLKRRNARNGHLAFTTYTKPDYEVNWHHELVSDVLDKFVAKEDGYRRVMIFEPPRHGKSEQVSRRLPAYIFGRNPNAKIIATAYSADLSSSFNRDVQRIIDSPEYQTLFPETRLSGSNIRTISGSYLRNSDIFEIVGYEGFYLSAGIGGSIVGRGFDYGIIDDPFKNRQEADSKTIRKQRWEWYLSTFYTRQEKNASILLTVTRWHQDDLAGRLIEAMETGGEKWLIINLPAIKEDDNNDYDIREIGEPLWVNKYDGKNLNAIKSTLGAYEWSAQYQQRPTLRDGGMFQSQWFQIVEAVPNNLKKVRYWDVASTEGDGDYTAGCLMGLDPRTKDVYILDMKHKQLSPQGVNDLMRQCAFTDGKETRIWEEQEPGSSGKAVVDSRRRSLIGFTYKPDKVSGGKELRASPFSAYAEAGNVKLLHGTWNEDFLQEMEYFPNGANDDQVDAASGAFDKLVTRKGSRAKNV